jgi:hypothetical protein
VNWDALGATAETLAAVGVIATLLYLAVQVRANTRSVRASSHQEMQRAAREVSLVLLQDPALSSLWATGLRDFYSLDPEERQRFGNLAQLYLNLFVTAEYEFEEGTFAESRLANWRAQLEIICARAGFAAWWERNEIHHFPPAFKRLVNQMIAEGQKSPAV